MWQRRQSDVSAEGRGLSAESNPAPSVWLKAQRVRSGRWLSLAVGFGLVAGFLLIARAWFLAQTVDGVIFSGAGPEHVQPWLWAMLGIFVLCATLTWSSEQAAFQAAVRVKLRLRDRLYARIQDSGPVRHGLECTVDLANSLTDGIEALEAYYARFLPAIALTALVPLSILAFVFPADWVSALVIVVTDLLIPLFMILIAPEFYLPLRNMDTYYHARTGGDRSGGAHPRDPGRPGRRGERTRLPGTRPLEGVHSLRGRYLHLPG